MPQLGVGKKGRKGLQKGHKAPLLLYNVNLIQLLKFSSRHFQCMGLCEKQKQRRGTGRETCA
jgi:hypothetical protein